MSSTSIARGRPREWMVAGAFLVAAIAMTWPLGRLWAPVLPDWHDSHFNVWRLSWVAHQLHTDPWHLFDANVFFPERNTLAYSDAIVLLGVMSAPLVWIGLHPFAVHNVMVISSFWLAAYCGYRLSLRCTNALWPAIAGGIVVGFAPYRFGHIAHLELLWTAFLPLGVLALIRIVERPTPAAGLRLGLCHAFQTLCSVYYGVFFAIYLGLAALLMLVRRPRRIVVASMASLAVAGLTALVILLPYMMRYREASRVIEPRPVHEIQRFSAISLDYLRGSRENRILHGDKIDGEEERALTPGVMAAVLAVCGIVVARRQSWIFTTLLIITIDLSLGLNGFLYPRLFDALPFLVGLRAPARFAALVLVSLSVLTAYGVVSLLQLRRAPRWLGPALAGIILLEYVAVPIKTRERPTKPPPVYAWLASQPKGVVLELPAPPAQGLWQDETEYQLMSIYHWQQLVNGYSGNAPPSYLRTLEAIERFPSHKATDHLRALGVKWVIIHDVFMGHAKFVDMMAKTLNSEAFRFVGSYADGFGHASVFELLQRSN